MDEEVDIFCLMRSAEDRTKATKCTKHNAQCFGESEMDVNVELMRCGIKKP